MFNRENIFEKCEELHTFAWQKISKNIFGKAFLKFLVRFLWKTFLCKKIRNVVLKANFDEVTF
jgi:hypothetical protein